MGDEVVYACVCMCMCRFLHVVECVEAQTCCSPPAPYACCVCWCMAPGASVSLHRLYEAQLLLMEDVAQRTRCTFSVMDSEIWYLNLLFVFMFVILFSSCKVLLFCVLGLVMVLTLSCWVVIMVLSNCWMLLLWKRLGLFAFISMFNTWLSVSCGLHEWITNCSLKC